MTYDEKLEILYDAVESGASKEDWENLVDELELDISAESLRKAFNCTEFSGFRVMQHLKEIVSTKYFSDEELKKIESAKWELKKEKYKLQDQRRELNKYARDEARFEQLVDVLKENIDTLEPIRFKPYIESKKNPKTYACSQWGDWHTGQTVDNPWNYYNIETTKQRVNQLVDKTIDKIKKFNITNLSIEIGGDMVEGLINVSSRVDAEEEVVQQIIIVSEILSQAISKIKEWCEIKVICVLGNHGRLGNKKDFSIKGNFEMLIPEFLKLRLNMPIHSSQGLDFTSYEINDKFICVTHGQYDKMSTLVADYSKIYKRVPDEIHVNHFHSANYINDCDVKIVVNGSLVGSGDFSLQCKKVTKPSQNMIIYDTDRCIYELELD